MAKGKEAPGPAATESASETDKPELTHGEALQTGVEPGDTPKNVDVPGEYRIAPRLEYHPVAEARLTEVAMLFFGKVGDRAQSIARSEGANAVQSPHVDLAEVQIREETGSRRSRKRNFKKTSLAGGSAVASAGIIQVAFSPTSTIEEMMAVLVLVLFGIAAFFWGVSEG